MLPTNRLPRHTTPACSCRPLLRSSSSSAAFEQQPSLALSLGTQSSTRPHGRAAHAHTHTQRHTHAHPCWPAPGFSSHSSRATTAHTRCQWWRQLLLLLLLAAMLAAAAAGDAAAASVSRAPSERVRAHTACPSAVRVRLAAPHTCHVLTRCSQLTRDLLLQLLNIPASVFCVCVCVCQECVSTAAAYGVHVRHKTHRVTSVCLRRTTRLPRPLTLRAPRGCSVGQKPDAAQRQQYQCTHKQSSTAGGWCDRGTAQDAVQVKPTRRPQHGCCADGRGMLPAALHAACRSVPARHTRVV
jgi:hypothetical protein